MNSPEDNDPVWDLLSSASKTEPSPYFSRNVVREVRLLEDARQNSFRGLWESLGFRVIASVGSAAVITALVIWSTVSNEDGTLPIAENSVIVDEPAATDSFDPESELRSAEYFGQLMAVTDPGDLSDEALAALFF